MKEKKWKNITFVLENDHSFRYSRETWQSEIMYTATTCVIAILFFILLLMSSLTLTPYLLRHLGEYTPLKTVYYQMSWTNFVIFLLLEGTLPTPCSQSPFTLWENSRKHYMFFHSPCHSFLHCFFGNMMLYLTMRIPLFSVLFITSFLLF